MNNFSFNGQGNIFSRADDVDHRVAADIPMRVPYRNVQDHPDFAGYSQTYVRIFL